MAPEISTEIFSRSESSDNLRNSTALQGRSMKVVSRTISSLAPKIWDILPKFTIFLFLTSFM